MSAVLQNHMASLHGLKIFFTCSLPSTNKYLYFPVKGCVPHTGKERVNLGLEASQPTWSHLEVGPCPIKDESQLPEELGGFYKQSAAERSSAVTLWD